MSITKQLLILGNGFDLHCGLKSSYKDFFESEIVTDSNNYWEITIRNNFSKFWEGLLFQYYRQFGNKDYEWCDIEKIIMETLWKICFGYNNKKSSNINEGIWYTALHAIKNRQVTLEETKDKIYDYLLNSCDNIFYNYYSKINRNYDNANFLLLLKKLLNELNNFENRFCKYIKNQIINPYNEQEINSNYVFRAINLLAKLTYNNYQSYCNKKADIFVDIMKIMSKEEASALANKYIYEENNSLTKEFASLKNTNILSFNYTNFFDTLKITNPCKYNNVHGKLCKNECKNCKCSNIIFGIDDTAIKSQNEIPELRLFSKTYRKMQNISAPTEILPTIDNNKRLEIKFYGHSLSSADYSYFQSIFDYYNIYDNNLVSLIFYYSKGYEQFDAIYDLINNYGNTLANKDQGKNLMHKLLLENRLKIVEIE